ncbi:MAG: hypothetical protein FJX06_18590 [Alphaproteobacteria bacterium]|nr:hypothetical protein [Alphaproteobacteria bacterium]
MKKRADLHARLPIRRGVCAEEAALYLGIGVSLFRVMVSDGRMPRPRMINARRVWDVDDLDAAFKSLPREGGERAEEDTWADVGRAF